MPPPEKLLRLPSVIAACGMSRSSVYVRIAQQLFPKPLTLGPRMVAWPESEIAAINAARIRGANDKDIRELVSKLVAARAQKH